MWTKVLQQALGLTKEQVELHLHTMISRLELAVPSTTFLKVPGSVTLKDGLEEYEDEDDCRVRTLVDEVSSSSSSAVLLDAEGFVEFRQMITQPERISRYNIGNDNIMFTNHDQSALAGHELYKLLAKDKDSSSPYTQWICQSHYSDLHPIFDPEDFVSSVHGLGEYAPQHNLLGSNVQSSADFEGLLKSKVVQSCPCRPRSEGHDICTGQIESLTLGNAQFLLKHVQELWNTSNDQTYGLGNIWLSIESECTPEDRDAVNNGFNNLVLNSLMSNRSCCYGTKAQQSLDRRSC
ncbi:hypothetical protein BGW39_008110 [Mortierella sp. 14UC]|nr:hypothetical protein BGW39_008110 [Mortierella sp. 14UC]